MVEVPSFWDEKGFSSSHAPLSLPQDYGHRIALVDLERGIINIRSLMTTPLSTLEGPLPKSATPFSPPPLLSYIDNWYSPFAKELLASLRACLSSSRINAILILFLLFTSCRLYPSFERVPSSGNVLSLRVLYSFSLKISAFLPKERRSLLRRTLIVSDVPPIHTSPNYVEIIPYFEIFFG